MLFFSSEILKSGLAELPVTFQVTIQLSPFHHPNVSQSCVCIDLVLACVRLVEKAVVIVLTFYLFTDKICNSF